MVFFLSCSPFLSLTLPYISSEHIYKLAEEHKQVSLLALADGEPVVHPSSAFFSSCPLHFGGQFSVSVFTLDYKGGVCSIEALTPQLA